MCYTVQIFLLSASRVFALLTVAILATVGLTLSLATGAGLVFAVRRSIGAEAVGLKNFARLGCASCGTDMRLQSSFCLFAHLRGR